MEECMMSLTKSVLTALWMIAAFSLPLTSWAEEDEDEILEPCTPEEIRIGTETQGDVGFVSGGIGRCEALEMQRLAREYPLELVFVKKTVEHEVYLANIPVVINDGKGNPVLDTVTSGPYLLANLPAGRYAISADYNGDIKTQQAVISKQHRRIVFVWIE
jgi:hypothetical protein